MIEPVYDKQGVTIYHDDSVEVMRSLPADSVDSIVTDPPYGIRFMGKAWDGVDIEKQTETRRKYGDGPSPTGGHNSVAANAGQYNTSLSSNQAFAEWTRVWAVEALRILKPGGHMLVFCGPRTYHRMASGVEDAGFEIRDQIMWLYGSGFPKSLDVSKAIDKAAGAEREVVGKRTDGRYASKGTDLTGGSLVDGSIPGGYENGIGGKEHDPETATPKRNVHPTVKPTSLMQYLLRLVTPPGGTTYDPFMGSGSTGKAAVREGFKFIGSEREAEYIPISIARINAPAQVELL